MNLAELTSRVKELNEKVNQYNKRREQEIGAKNVAEQEYARCVAEYKEKYGVSVDDKNIQAEYTGVFNSVAQEVANIEAVMKAVEEKKFDDNSKKFDIKEPEVNLEEMIAEAGKKFDETNNEPEEEERVIIDGSSSTVDKEAEEAEKERNRAAIADTAQVMNFIAGTSGQAQKIDIPMGTEDDVPFDIDSEDTSVNFDASDMSDGFEVNDSTTDEDKTDNAEDTPEVKFEEDDSDGDDEVIEPDGWGDDDGSGIDLNALFDKELGASFK